MGGDYKYTLRVYQMYNMKDLDDKNEVYYFIDAIKLIVGENFTMNMHERFKRDPLSFVTIPLI